MLGRGAGDVEGRSEGGWHDDIGLGTEGSAAPHGGSPVTAETGIPVTAPRQPVPFPPNLPSPGPDREREDKTISLSLSSVRGGIDAVHWYGPYPSVLTTLCGLDGFRDFAVAFSGTTCPQCWRRAGMKER